MTPHMTPATSHRVERFATGNERKASVGRCNLDDENGQCAEQEKRVHHGHIDGYEERPDCEDNRPTGERGGRRERDVGHGQKLLVVASHLPDQIVKEEGNTVACHNRTVPTLIIQAR